MSYVIDGYNLLYAMGVLQGRTGPTALHKARLGLLGLLSGTYGDDPPAITVVFDAAKSPPGLPHERDYRGIHIRFATHDQQADDVIEELILHDSAPRRLTVVSDDHRLQQAAQRRHCSVLGCTAYLDLLQRNRRERRPPAPDPGAKPQGMSQRDAEHWLRAFAEVQDDPRLRELSDPAEWREIES
jgi:predicted RNA-binding protein with PIN domain